MFTVTDAASGAEILKGQLPLNRVCLHMGKFHYAGAEAMAADLGSLYVGEGMTWQDPFSETRAYIRRVA